MREYPEKSASHLLGYVSQVPDYILKKNDYYKKNDNYGMTGVENSYEKELRGTQGLNMLFVRMEFRKEVLKMENMIALLLTGKT